jgi:hypothetical protein
VERSVRRMERKKSRESGERRGMEREERECRREERGGGWALSVRLEWRRGRERYVPDSSRAPRLFRLTQEHGGIISARRPNTPLSALLAEGATAPAEGIVTGGVLARRRGRGPRRGPHDFTKAARGDRAQLTVHHAGKPTAAPRPARLRRLLSSRSTSAGDRSARATGPTLPPRAADYKVAWCAPFIALVFGFLHRVPPVPRPEGGEPCAARGEGDFACDGTQGRVLARFSEILFRRSWEDRRGRGRDGRRGAIVTKRERGGREKVGGEGARPGGESAGERGSTARA